MKRSEMLNIIAGELMGFDPENDTCDKYAEIILKRLEEVGIRGPIPESLEADHSQMWEPE